MIEKKSFFTENNQLNKGYKTERKPYEKKALRVDLPEASILAEYENMQPGTIARMMEMTSKEQEHRHTIEVIQLKMQKTALRMGRVFAIFSVMAICYTSLTLAANHMQDEAMIFAAIGFLAIAVSALAGRSRTPAYKKPFVPHHKRPYQENRHQNQNRPAPAVAQVSGEESTSNATSSNYKPHYRRRKKV